MRGFHRRPRRREENEFDDEVGNVLFDGESKTQIYEMVKIDRRVETS